MILDCFDASGFSKKKTLFTREYAQIAGIDHTENFAPVIPKVSFTKILQWKGVRN